MRIAGIVKATFSRSAPAWWPFMHIPDGPLSPAVCAATGAISVAAVGYSLRRMKASLADRTVPLTGMMASLVFAGQMVNFRLPLPGVGVSGHLLGGVLAACVVGPWAGCVAITLVLLVQCALFADGGVTTLGANVLHMAVIGSIGGYSVYAAIRRWLGDGFRGTVVGAVAASWLSVMAAAALFCLEFRLSWPADGSLGRMFALMVTYHSVIGVVEALITGTVVSFVLRHQPELIRAPETTTAPLRIGRFVAAGLVVALAVAAFLAPFASPLDDGLDAVAGKIFPDRATESPIRSPLPDYQVPLPFADWQNSPAWAKVSVSLAGVLGTAAVMGIALLFGRAFGKPAAVAASPPTVSG